MKIYKINITEDIQALSSDNLRRLLAVLIPAAMLDEEDATVQDLESLGIIEEVVPQP